MTIIMADITLTWFSDNISWVGPILFTIISAILIGIYKLAKKKFFRPRIILEQLRYDYQNIPSPKGDLYWLRVWAINKSGKIIKNCKMIVKSIKFYDTNTLNFTEMLDESVVLPWAHPNVQIAPIYETDFYEYDKKKAAYVFRYDDNSILEFTRDNSGNGKLRFFEKGIYEVTVLCHAENAKGDEIRGKILFDMNGRLPKIESL